MRHFKTFSLLALFAFCSLSLSAQQVVKGEITDVEKHETYTPSFENDGADRKPVNVILMIGDGMGLAHLSAGMYANGGELTITNLQTCGWSRTQSASDFTTDSAASGTAYACGQKTFNGAIGVDVDKNPIANLPEKLAKHGIVSGIVTTDDVEGATPSAFFAHQPSRHMKPEIWSDLADAAIIFFAGGKWEDYEKQDEKTVKAIEDRYYVTNTLDTRKASKAKRLGYLPYGEVTASKSEGRGDFLPSSTSYAIDFLQSRASDGFFLMVEGARIDKSSHGNDFPTTVQEVLDFDRAVEAAIRFAEKDGNTLVIISADHETGALALRNGDPKKGNVSGTYSSGGHTAIPVPLFAYGPGSQYFRGVQENSDVSNKINALMTEGK